MADEQDGPTRLGHPAHLAKAFVLKRLVTDGQHLVHDQNLRIEVGRHAEGQPHAHPRGVAFDWRVEKFLDFRKCHDFVEFSADFRGSSPGSSH